MPHLDNVTPEEMPEVVRIASLLYEEERAAAQERKSTIEAAAELDLPAEYLERAAEELRARRIAEAKQRKRRKVGIMATAGAVLALGGIWTVTHLPALTPKVYDFESAPQTQWALNESRGAKADVKFTQEAGHGGVAVIHVDKFQSGTSSGQYYVNLDTMQGPQSLARYKTVSFKVRGTGLSHIRLALENGNERARSAVLPVSGEWQTYTLRLGSLDLQKRSSSESAWYTPGSGYPAQAQKISFKLGDFVNQPNQSGDVEIDDVELR